MFDFSLAELMLVVVVAVVFIGPKDLPVVLRAIAKGFAHLRSLASELKQAFDDLARESGVEETMREVKRETRLITGDDGKHYEAYDIEDFLPRK